MIILLYLLNHYIVVKVAGLIQLYVLVTKGHYMTPFICINLKLGVVLITWAMWGLVYYIL